MGWLDGPTWTCRQRWSKTRANESDVANSGEQETCPTQRHHLHAGPSQTALAPPSPLVHSRLRSRPPLTSSSFAPSKPAPSTSCSFVPSKPAPLPFPPLVHSHLRRWPPPPLTSCSFTSLKPAPPHLLFAHTFEANLGSPSPKQSSSRAFPIPTSVPPPNASSLVPSGAMFPLAL